MPICIVVWSLRMPQVRFKLNYKLIGARCLVSPCRDVHARYASPCPSQDRSICTKTQGTVNLPILWNGYAVRMLTLFEALCSNENIMPKVDC